MCKNPVMPFPIKKRTILTYLLMESEPIYRAWISTKRLELEGVIEEIAAFDVCVERCQTEAENYRSVGS